MTDHPPQPGPMEPSQDVPAEEPLTFWARWGEMAIAIGVLILGIVVLVETQDIRIRQGVVVSPRIIPQIVGAGLVLVAIWYAVDVIRFPRLTVAGGDSEDVDPEATADWSVIITIAIALGAYAALIDTAGFIVASTVLFFISTFAMHSRRYLRNILVGLLLAVGIYLLFDGWLGVRLPNGWLEDFW